MLRCPDCGAQLRDKDNGEGNFLTMKDLERSRKRCTAEVVVEHDKDGNPDHPPLWCRLVAICRQASGLGAGRLHPQAHERGLRLSDLRRGP